MQYNSKSPGSGSGKQSRVAARKKAKRPASYQRRKSAPAANAPLAQAAQTTGKQAAKAPSPANGAPRHDAAQASDANIAKAADASVEAGAAEGQGDSLDASTNRFLEFYQLAYKAKFRTTAKVTEEDLVAVRNLLRQGEWMVSDLVLILLRAWGLIGQPATDGKYKYPCCQHTLRIAKFVQHFDRVLTDTESNNIGDLRVEEVLAQIARLTGFDPETVAKSFAPELKQDEAKEAQPEIKLENMPDPQDVIVQSYVRDTLGIPFEWIQQKLIPHLADNQGPLPPGKLEFLLAYWQIWRKYEKRNPQNIENDYTVMRKHKSPRFDEADARTQLLVVVDTLFKEYVPLKGTPAAESATWPTLGNVFALETARALLSHKCLSISKQNKSHSTI